MSSDDSLVWGNHDLDDPVANWRIGPLSTWVYREAKEFFVAYTREETAPQKDSNAALVQIPEHAELLRWAIETERQEFSIQPVFPEVPIVARPDSPFRVADSGIARIYIRIPVWVQIRLPALKKERIEVDIPTVVLSKTWSGTLTEGELCYWVPTSARRDITPHLFEPHMAVCPVEIRNESGEELQVERLTLQVKHSSLFAAEGQLWADETLIRFLEGKKGTRVKVSGKAPQLEAPRARLLSPPREIQRASFSAKTFSWIKDLPGFGLIS